MEEPAPTDVKWHVSISGGTVIPFDTEEEANKWAIEFTQNAENDNLDLYFDIFAEPIELEEPAE